MLRGSVRLGADIRLYTLSTTFIYCILGSTYITTETLTFSNENKKLFVILGQRSSSHYHGLSLPQQHLAIQQIDTDDSRPTVC